MYASHSLYNWTSVAGEAAVTDIVDLRLSDEDGTPRPLHSLSHPVTISMPLFSGGKTSQICLNNSWLDMSAVYKTVLRSVIISVISIALFQDRFNEASDKVSWVNMWSIAYREIEFNY